ncbi:MAG: FAD/NAD(P)-binding oxidoreductase [Candidatus Acidiferrales bacterium]
MKHLRFDVAVVGAGPAGIAAALAAADSGCSVGLLDDNPAAGGQIWRATHDCARPSAASIWFDRLNKSAVQIVRGARVFHAAKGELAAESDSAIQISYGKLILATGARELFLPFPGWTLPNVMGAGGLQAFVKSGLDISGRRIVIAGTGPLILAVAAYARKCGAKVIGICEQTTRPKMARFALKMMLIWGKSAEAMSLAYDLRGIPHWTDCWPVAAFGNRRVESVRISRHGQTGEIECDYLACGFHLIPNVELPRMCGCHLREDFVAVDEYQQTSIPGIFCAGEPTGIGGLELALVEGEIAGYAATNWEDRAKHLFAKRARHQKVVRILQHAFPLRPELKNLARPDTLVCRCEDVPHERLSEHRGWRAAKLHTRCGMGPCQGRICAPAAEFLFGWQIDSVRPPLFPVRCSSLAAIAPHSAARN